MQTLVADKLSHVEQLKMRQSMISMERQIENDNKERQDARIKELNKKYEVSGIPWLVVLNAKTGALVHNEAATVVGQGTPAYDKWLATAVAQAA